MRILFLMPICLLFMDVSASASEPVKCPAYWSNEKSHTLKLIGMELIDRNTIDAPGITNKNFSTYEVGGEGYALRCFYYPKDTPISKELHYQAHQIIIPIPPETHKCIQEFSGMKTTSIHCF